MEKRRRVLRALFKRVALLILSEIMEVAESEINKKDKIWVRRWMAKRSTRGSSEQITKELRNEDPHEFRMYMRMKTEQFDDLLNLITPRIQRKNTLMRDAIPAKVKLEICLTYLATGASYRWLQNNFRVSMSAISQLVPEVCTAIFEGLKDYIQVPSSQEAWMEIETGFMIRWNFPNCYGAIDGKHVTIQAPPNSGSIFHNYKGYSSIVLLALVDHNYCFTYIDVGANGMASDAGIFDNSSLKAALKNLLLHDDGLIVGDDAFPLKPYLMKPYSRSQNLTYGEKLFNCRLSRARRIVENAFGILVSRFRVFQKPILVDVTKVNKIVMGACTLHNWLRRTSPNTYTPPNSTDFEEIDNHRIMPGTWRNDNNNLQSIKSGSNRYSEMAKATRDKYQHYFLHEGSVPWQAEMIY